MKINRIFFIISIMTAALLQAQKKKKDNYNDILTTTDIERIETFLKDAHPEDPRRIVLKPKLVALKNSNWVKGRENHKPMEARPITSSSDDSVINVSTLEEEEFKKLLDLEKKSKNHTEKTLKLLNTMFDQDINKKEAILLIQNRSDCNIILRIQNDNFSYSLPIPKKEENHIIVNKDSYSMKSNVCGATYSSSKNIEKGMIIIINNPVAKP